MDTASLITLTTLMLTTLGGVITLIRYTDKRITKSETNLKDDIAQLRSDHHRLADRIDVVEERVFRLAVGWPQEPLSSRTLNSHPEPAAI